MALVTLYYTFGVAMPAFLLYDDACHLLGRLLSLMGTFWQASAALCLAVLIDRFHFVNHISALCVGQ